MRSSIKVSRDNFFSITSKAILFAKKKPVLPVEETFRIFTRDNSIVVAAYNGEAYIEACAPCTIVGDPLPCFLVNAFMVHALIKMSIDPEITITLAERGENVQAVFKSGRSTHKFPTYPDEMPVLKANDTIFSTSIRGYDLHSISNTVTNLIDDSEGNMQVMGMGVCMQYIEQEKSMFFWGGSGARAGAYIVPMDKPEGFQDVIVSSKTMDNLDELFKGTENVDVVMKGTVLEMEGEDVFLRTKTVDHKYPNMYRILSSRKEHKAIVNFSVNEIRLAVEKLMLHVTKDFVAMNMSFGPSSATITIDNSVYSQAGIEEVPYLGAEKIESASMSSNLIYLQQILKQSISDQAQFAVPDGTSAVIISSKKDGRSIVFMLGQHKMQ